ncbi:YjbH domain-containing protein [Ramlibacter algicola]|uniref:YjbH domain-containing protein n=1 Tax=Ramlibacter algicola TaxID=2795217 RepID=A0A934PYZ6_9BURK|nr:YjbH domain-containing protein [Ramlibacter algicola]MBK0391978.1 YjbH domain-containing protein [Ramlibacter algicola]
MRARLLLPIAAAFVASPALAVDTTLTGAGFSGLGITPTAGLLSWGNLGTSYENQVSGIARNTSGHNLALGVGLLPNMEVAGRLATNSLHDNCFFSAGGCGARDLSASGKFGIGLDTAGRWNAAVGITDVGGSVTYFRSYYGVLTYDTGPFQASGGLAKRSGRGINGSASPLSGAFASLAWQPMPLLRAHVEYSDGKAWAGARVFAPQAWLPEGWGVSAGVNASLNRSPLTQRTWWNAALTVPLYKVPAMPGRDKAPLLPLQEGQRREPSYEARAGLSSPGTESKKAEALDPRVQGDDKKEAVRSRLRGNDGAAPGGAAASPSDAQLQALANALQAKGLQDIWVGRTADGMVAVRVENGSWQWNSADALGVALGVVARNLSESRSGYRLVLTVRQVPLVAVTGQADCLREWIEQPSNTCTAGQLSTPGSQPLRDIHDGAVWLVQRQNPGWQTLRVSISPVVRTNSGTEFGAFDASVGANIKAQLPLWAGASVEGAVDVPIDQSRNYEPEGVFGEQRVRSGIERLAFTQTTRVPVERWLTGAQDQRWSPGAVTAQVTAGRVGRFYDGALAELRWEPGEGRHRLSAMAGALRNNEYMGGLGPLGGVRRAMPVIGSYRYSVMATRTDLEATAGQFMNNDRGLRVGLRQWFADTAVSVFYKRTTTDGNPARQLVGLELSIPIGPRRDWQPLPHLQVGGTSRFAIGRETTVRESGSNPIRRGRAELPPTPDLNAVFNSDRSGLAYFEDNLRRIRDAAR